LSDSDPRFFIPEEVSKIEENHQMLFPRKVGIVFLEQTSKNKIKKPEVIGFPFIEDDRLKERER
jgi:hypothetical protein